MTTANANQTITSTVTLSAAGNPYNIPSTLDITVSGASGYDTSSIVDAVYGTGGANFVPIVSNHGTIASSDVQGVGIKIGGSSLSSAAQNQYNGFSAGIANYGTISGGRYGVDFESQGNTSEFLNNAGTIEGGLDSGGGFRAGVEFGFGAGGTVVNSGVIDGNTGFGVYFKTVGGNPDSIVNSGTIATNDGAPSVFINQGNGGAGGVTNSGDIQHGIFLVGVNNGTVTNSGTVGELGNGSTIAISDARTGTLILDPGQSIGGGVATFGSGSTLDLAGAGSGTLANPGSYIGFTSLAVSAGASWTVGGSIAGIGNILNDGALTLGGTQGAVTIDAGGNGANSVTNLAGTDGQVSITDFGAGDTLIASGSNFTSNPNDSVTETYNNGTLTVSDSTTNSTFSVALAVTPGDSTSSFTTTTTANKVSIAIPCYASGTRILTAEGEMNVEDLVVGMHVITVREGGPAMREIVWTGKRSIDIARHPDPAIVRPVRILAGAFGNNLPERDLRLSPHHAVYVNGCLFEAMSLINHVTIIQETTTSHVTYHHIQLDAHDVMLAEGLPAESFLNTGNRNMFESVSDSMVLHADFRPAGDAVFCAPMIREGAKLAALRAALQTRADTLGVRAAA